MRRTPHTHPLRILAFRKPARGATLYDPPAALGALLIAATVVCAASVTAQRVEYPATEFTERRARLCEALRAASAEPAGGAALLFSATLPRYGVRFRQDHDFYYASGVESRNAALLIDVATCDAHLFLPVLGEREKFIDGPNWLDRPQEGIDRGFATVQPVTYLPEALARRRGRGGPQGDLTLWMRLSERDEIDLSRSEKGIFLGRREGGPLGGLPSESSQQVETLRARYPQYEIRDIAPKLDTLRMIKTAREIKALRQAGRVSANGIGRAIAVTRPGLYEYDLEAEAKHVFLKGGAEMEAYPAIVGSGPNGNIWHWNKNDRVLEAGDMIVMDYGGSFGYQTMDITRTWPVSGRFDDIQKRAYKAVLEAQKAIIEAMVPGATRAETTAICREIYDRHGFQDKPAHGAGHFVGMSVHDVGDPDLPFAPGMVIAVEPIIEIPEYNIHVRIEDTVLITEGTPENLSIGVPKEVDELLALVGSASRPREGAASDATTAGQRDV